MLAHCCEKFVRELELPVKPPVQCSTCGNQIVFDLIEMRAGIVERKAMPFNNQRVAFSISNPAYLEPSVTINTKEYEIESDWDFGAIQKNTLGRYFSDFPIFDDKRYRNSVTVIRSGPRAKALAKTLIVA